MFLRQRERKINAGGGNVPAELDGLSAWIACIADARQAREYVQHLEAAGLSDVLVESHDNALAEMVSAIRSKLLGADLLVKLGKMSLPGVDIESAASMARAAERAVRTGQLGYALIVGRKA